MIKAQFKNAILLPGVVGAFLAIAMFLTLYFSGIHLYDLAFRLDVWITLPFIGVSIWYFKKATGGELRFWQGLVLGFGVNWVFLLVYCCFLALFLEVISPAFLEASKLQILHIAESQRDSALAADPKFDFNAEMASLKAHVSQVSAWTHIADKIIWFSILSTIFTFLLSVILRK